MGGNMVVVATIRGKRVVYPRWQTNWKREFTGSDTTATRETISPLIWTFDYYFSLNDLNEPRQPSYHGSEKKLD